MFQARTLGFALSLIAFVLTSCQSTTRVADTPVTAKTAAPLDPQSAKLAGDLYRKALAAPPEDRTAHRQLFASACEAGSSAACLQLGKRPEESALGRVPILQGMTSDTTTQVSLLLEKTSTDQILLWEEETGRLMPAFGPLAITSREFSPWAAGRIRYEGLKPEKTYRLELVSGNGQLVDYRWLKTLPRVQNTFRFALISCMHDRETEMRERMWPEVLSQRPDFLFLIGDNVYADSWEGKPRTADAKQLWERYVQTRRALPLFFVPNLTPSLSVWDDHDTGKNDGDKNFPHIQEASRIFRAFFPQEPVKGWLENGPGLASEFTFAGQKFYFLDDRSFRTANVIRRDASTGQGVSNPEAASGQQAHFGQDQEDWLFTRLKRTRHPAWLISGDQFFGGYHPFESYEGSHPKAFETFLRRLKAMKTRPFIFASGDRHLTEIIAIPKDVLGFATYELTSSGIHAKMFPGALKENPNPRQIVGRDGLANYMILSSQVHKDGTLSVATSAYGPGRDVIFERGLEVKP